MGMNGIPRAFSPSQFRQEFLDFKRKVEQQLSGRTYVNLANITVSEGGTIDSGVGDKLTETVKDKIVIDGGNLGEGALDGQRMVGAIIETNDAANRGVKIDDTGLRGYDADGNRYMKADENGLEMTGSISTKGKTAEAVPRDISVSMTTLSRDVMGNVVPNPGIIFEAEGASRTLSPGIYSPDGKSLYLGSASATGTGLIILGPSTSIASQSISLGGTIFGGLVDIDTPGNAVTVGVQAGSLGGTNANVNLLGNVKVNGGQVMKTVIAGLPAGAQPVELIGTGSARTSAAGVFAITFPPGTFPTACMSIQAVPTSGTAGIPVVNSGRLFAGSAEMVIPSAPNTTITYSYRAVGY